MPLIIGVTGSIATGKSTACRVMSEMGAAHCDADRLVHRLYDPEPPRSTASCPYSARRQWARTAS